jgi:hypothetical protein
MVQEKLDSYPNPWSFHNENKELTSLDGKNKIEYSDLGEIAMGAPLGGYCQWIDQKGQVTKLKKWFGGPAVWNSEGTKVAIPTWTKKLLRGTVQQIVILDVVKRELTRYKKTFDVLDLRTFNQNEICGYESPIYKTKTVKFDLLKEGISEREKI